MRRILLLMAFVAILAQLSGCATYRNQHGGYSSGISGDLDIFGFGADASVGVHSPYGQRGGYGYGNGGYPLRAPGQASLEIMQSTEPLAQWASRNEQAPVRRYQNCNVSEFSGRTSYGCSAGHSSQSVSINGTPVIAAPHPGYLGGNGYHNNGYSQYNQGYRDPRGMRPMQDYGNGFTGPDGPGGYTGPDGNGGRRNGR